MISFYQLIKDLSRQQLPLLTADLLLFRLSFFNPQVWPFSNTASWACNPKTPRRKHCTHTVEPAVDAYPSKDSTRIPRDTAASSLKGSALAMSTADATRERALQFVLVPIFMLENFYAGRAVQRTESSNAGEGGRQRFRSKPRWLNAKNYFLLSHKRFATSCGWVISSPTVVLLSTFSSSLGCDLCYPFVIILRSIQARLFQCSAAVFRVLRLFY
ncbi:hypothetical protein GALMADRAFT_1146527 [Galerina marginata CBS 339.88]|uniref:Uncharacterized protein n=1 Tax=Galerina marginata (strain CBS 339.88) TaxID=685588 RepID=A0A067SIJ3_GALM3|nr:hypothetical protein GALMADRAFT_1146527 [Galerina marginata CBS 339.88]